MHEVNNPQQVSSGILRESTLSQSEKLGMPKAYFDRAEVSNFGPAIVSPLRAILQLLEEAFYRTFICEMITTVITGIFELGVVVLSFSLGAGIAALLYFSATSTQAVVDIQSMIYGAIIPIWIGLMICSVISLIVGLWVQDVPRRLSIHTENRMKGGKTDFTAVKNTKECLKFVFMLYLTSLLEGLIFGVIFDVAFLILLFIPVIGWIGMFFVLPYILMLFQGFYFMKIVFLSRNRYAEVFSWVFKHQFTTIGLGLGTLLTGIIPFFNIFSNFSGIIAATKTFIYIDFVEKTSEQEIDNILKGNTNNIINVYQQPQPTNVVYAQKPVETIQNQPLIKENEGKSYGIQ